MIELNKIYNEDCRETMKRMENNSIDSIVTDPPYGISFMGKEWDSFDPKYQEIQMERESKGDHVQTEEKQLDFKKVFMPDFMI